MEVVFMRAPITFPSVPPARLLGWLPLLRQTQGALGDIPLHVEGALCGKGRLEPGCELLEHRRKRGIRLSHRLISPAHTTDSGTAIPAGLGAAPPSGATAPQVPRPRRVGSPVSGGGQSGSQWLRGGDL